MNATSLNIKDEMGVIHVADFSDDERLFVESITEIVNGTFIDEPKGDKGFGVYATHTEAWIKFWRLY